MAKASTRLTAGLLLLALVLVSYAPAIRAGFIWDDDGYVENNLALRSFDGLRQIWFRPGATQDYYPLTFTSFWIEWSLWQARPLGYHVVNILLHALNVILLWQLLERLKVPGALLAAAIFAVHPVHVESVAWITERKNVLSGALVLLSLHAFVRFARLDEEPSGTVKHNWWFYVLSVGAYFLAMLAKTVVVPLPLLLPVLVWWKRGRLTLRDGLLVLPYFVVIAPLFVIASLKHANFAGAGVNIFSTEGPEWQLSLLERLLLAGRVLWFYAGKFLWPDPLMFVYPRWTIDAADGWQYLYPILAVGLVVVLWLFRGRMSRGPLAAALVFGLMLAPASGFFNFYFQRYSYVADHLQYLASLGPTILIASLAATISVRLRWSRSARLTTSTALLAGLCALAWRQEEAYVNRESLWNDTIRKNPECWMAHNNLGVFLRGYGRINEAIPHYREALRLNPEFFDAHNNLGGVLMGLGQIDEAMAHFNEALRVMPDSPVAHYNLARALQRLEKMDEAIAHYHETLRLMPSDFEAHTNLGSVFQNLGQVDKAIAHYREALRLKPDFPIAHNNLGIALQSVGKNDEAMEHYRETLQLKPDSPIIHHNMAIILKGRGRIDEAISHHREALRIKPDYPEANNDLAWILATCPDARYRDGQQAVQLAEKACDLSGGKQAMFFNTLAAAYAEIGNFDLAVRAQALALRLSPKPQQSDYQSRLDLYKSGKPFRREL